MRIAFATNNAHKLREIRDILGERVEVLSLGDIGCHDEIPETHDTLEGNAIEKATYVFERYHIGCFADDTGLEVEALGGEPGVRTARYAGGRGHDSEANMAKLLRSLEGETNRRARFRTVIALITEDASGEPKLFEGTVQGEITTERRGDGGFGYDPVFKPLGHDGTFAELGKDVKNAISHRGLAVAKLADYLIGTPDGASRTARRKG